MIAYVNKNNTAQENLQGLLSFLNIEKSGLKLIEYDKDNKQWMPKKYKSKDGQPSMVDDPCNF